MVYLYKKTGILAINLYKKKQGFWQYIYTKNKDFGSIFIQKTGILAVYLYKKKRILAVYLYKKQEFWQYIYTKKQEFWQYIYTNNMDFRVAFIQTIPLIYIFLCKQCFEITWREGTTK